MDDIQELGIFNALFGVTPKGYRCPSIEKVIFNGPCTIVLWSDKTKTVVHCGNEEFDKEKGLAMAIAKKALGNKGSYFDTFKKWIVDESSEI